MKIKNIHRLKHLCKQTNQIQFIALVKYSGVSRHRLQYTLQFPDKHADDPAVGKIIAGLESDGIKIIADKVDKNILQSDEK